MKKTLRAKVIIILIAVIVCGALLYSLLLTNIFNKYHESTIDIPIGSSTQSIAIILKENNIIKNDYIFRLFAKIEKKGDKFKAGKYTLNNKMSMKEIFSELEKGVIRKETVSFTIPEGYELKQIAKRLSELGIVNYDNFIKLTSDKANFNDKYEFLQKIPDDSSLEGYLYPETYEVYLDASEEEVIEKMLDEFNNIYNEIITKKDLRDDFDLNKFMTLASIVEREARVDEERPTIAGVFYNRLNDDMLLQSCATVQYILGERKPRLSNKDISIDNPFNTYKYIGLPPAPIASPGIESIKATLQPEEHDYLYFVLKPDESGRHNFNTNYKDHLRDANKLKNKN